MKYGIYIYHVNDLIKSVEPKVVSIFGFDNALKSFNDYYDKAADTLASLFSAVERVIKESGIELYSYRSKQCVYQENFEDFKRVIFIKILCIWNYNWLTTFHYRNTRVRCT